MKLPVFVDPRYHDAVIFDLDGVVTDTAAIHEAAWKAMFDDYLARRPAVVGEDHGAFTDDDYRNFVDGKPRFDGVADFLKSRGVSLPRGSEDDRGIDTVCGLGNDKQRLFLELLSDGVPVFGSTVEFVRQLQAAQIGTAVFSSSRNCAHILAAAGLSELFPVRVDGLTARELGLPGKPDPAVLHETAKRLAVHPQRCVVVEDAVAGVTAGRDGGFGLVIGVDRTGNADELLRFGADVVVPDLVAVTLRSGYEPISAMADALESYGEIAALAETRQPAVLLDFDGTVSEIVNDPDAASLIPGAGEVLESLAARCPVAVVSGRGLEDIKARIGVPGIWYAGSHGFELLSPDGTYHQNEVGAEAIRVLADAESELRERLAGIGGLVVENKRFSVAVHYRNVAQDRVDGVTAAVRIIGQRNNLRVTGGRMVIELRPDVDWGKGKTLEWILDQLDGRELLLPIYIGDDLTDEDAFDAIRHKGIGVAVRNAETGDRRSAARFALDDPDAVLRFLTRISDQLAVEQNSSNDPWTLTFGGYQPVDERLREALCTVGNGYMAVRGAAPECAAGEFHYPGTYVAGIYNRLTDEVAGSAIDNESLVNLPNWLPVTFRIDGGPWFDIDDVDASSYLVTVDLRRATLLRELVFRDHDGRTTKVTQRRFIAMHLPHVAAMETEVHAQNWSGRVEFRSLVDGDVQNRGVERYRDLSSRHFAVVGLQELSEDSVLLAAETLESKIGVAVALRNTVHRDGVEEICPASPVRGRTSDRTRHRRRRELRSIGHAGEGGDCVHESRSRHFRTGFRRRTGAQSHPRIRGTRTRTPIGMGPPVGALQHRDGSRCRPAANCPAAPIARVANTFAAHRRRGRRRARPRAARRGVQRTRLLGRTVRTAVPQPAVPRGGPGPAAVPLAAAAGGATRGQRGRPRRRDVPVAERRRRPRRDAGPPSQSALRPLAAGQLAPAAARRARDRLQHLAVLPGDRGPGLPASTTVPRCCWRSPASGPASRRSTPTRAGTTSAESWAPTSTTTPIRARPGPASTTTPTPTSWRRGRSGAPWTCWTISRPPIASNSANAWH